MWRNKHEKIKVIIIDDVCARLFDKSELCLCERIINETNHVDLPVWIKETRVTFRMIHVLIRIVDTD